MSDTPTQQKPSEKEDGVKVSKFETLLQQGGGNGRPPSPVKAVVGPTPTKKTDTTTNPALTNPNVRTNVDTNQSTYVQPPKVQRSRQSYDIKDDLHLDYKIKALQMKRPLYELVEEAMEYYYNNFLK